MLDKKQLNKEQLEKITGGSDAKPGVYVIINYSGNNASDIPSVNGFVKGPFTSEEEAVMVGIDYCNKGHDLGYNSCSYQVFVYENGNITYREEVFI